MTIISKDEDQLLEVKNISKVFPGVIALDDVSLSFRSGEVHGLVGKNGAGKSTLIKIVSGIYSPDSGEIIYDGNTYQSLDPAHAHRLGIQVVPQEQQFQPHLNVAENMFIGSWPTDKAGFVNFDQIKCKAQEALAKLNIPVPVSRLARDLTLVQRQIIAIARAIFLEARLIILDEPTPALTANETNMLFHFVRDLASKGITFIYISHYLNEVFEVCDRVSVLRDGRLVHTDEIQEISTPQLVRYMIGKTVESDIRREVILREEIFRVDNLSSLGLFSNVTFSIRKGEILGITGLMGCGAFELAKSLFGLIPLDSGEIYLNNERIKTITPEKALENGIALLPDERRALGLIVKHSVDFNINMSNFTQLVDRMGFIDEKMFTEIARKFVKLLGIATPSLIQEVRFLSGGNQQKVVVSRLLNTQPEVLVMLDPTAGIDVEAKAEIHRLMNDLTKEGLSILLLSTDLDELLNLSDRVLVMHQGRMITEFPHSEATKQSILVASEGITEVI